MEEYSTIPSFKHSCIKGRSVLLTFPVTRVLHHLNDISVMKTKTIEERSYDYTIQRECIICNPSTLLYMRDAYKDGATEQKAIDDAELAEVKRQRDEYYDELLKLRRQKVEIIDKACEWLGENAFSWIDDSHINEDTRVLKEQKIAELQDSLRKAMEE